MKDHVHHAVVTPSRTLGIGVDFVGALPSNAKRAKHVAPPPGTGRSHAVATGDGFVLGGAGGLWWSADGTSWDPVPSFSSAVMAILPSK
ncbi:MAG: hypothetical protein JNL79_13315 [Myxococcales bacterium]|nr:hypothetical protein [Myxococcales bacterium]